MCKDKEQSVNEQTDVEEKSTAEQTQEVSTEEENKPNELEVLKQQNNELNDKILRTYAEFDNFKKRTHKEKEEMMVYSKSICIKEILTIVDNFERALASECKDEEFKKGMEMIFNQLNERLVKLGVEEIEALNKPFDPEFHNAVNQIQDEKFGENTVCEVFQKGYKIGDKVIRHAMVVVANP